MELHSKLECGHHIYVFQVSFVLVLMAFGTHGTQIDTGQLDFVASSAGEWHPPIHYHNSPVPAVPLPYYEYPKWMLEEDKPEVIQFLDGLIPSGLRQRLDSFQSPNRQSNNLPRVPTQVSLTMKFKVFSLQ